MAIMSNISKSGSLSLCSWLVSVNPAVTLQCNFHSSLQMYIHVSVSLNGCQKRHIQERGHTYTVALHSTLDSHSNWDPTPTSVKITKSRWRLHSNGRLTLQSLSRWRPDVTRNTIPVHQKPHCPLLAILEWRYSCLPCRC